MQLFWTTLCVGLGGGIGAMLRYHITLAANRFLGLTFPFGTLIVNLLGGFAIGFLLALAQSAAWLDTDHRAFLITGLLGGLTTFSTFSAESITLLTGAQPWLGILNIAANLCGALLAVIIGRSLCLHLF